MRMNDKERFRHYPKPAFGNAEYQFNLTHTVETDPRIMSFVDVLWGFEVTGGYDQFEPLTIINVNRSGYAKRAGLRLNDRITRINDTYTDFLTLREAQLLIRQSGKHVRIYVQGDDEVDLDDEYTVDFWFTPPKKKIFIENKWKDNFPWNDRKKKSYRESNCFMVPSKVEEQVIARLLSHREPIVITESAENVVNTQNGGDQQIVANGSTNGSTNGELASNNNTTDTPTTSAQTDTPDNVKGR